MGLWQHACIFSFMGAHHYRKKERKKKGQSVCFGLKRKSFHFHEEGSYVCFTWGFKGFGASSEFVQKLLLLLASIFAGCIKCCWCC
jgi:hypothetical protein